MSTPTTSTCLARSVRISASPRWPALPVTSIFMACATVYRAGTTRMKKLRVLQLRLSGHRRADAARRAAAVEQHATLHRERRHRAGHGHRAHRSARQGRRLHQLQAGGDLRSGEWKVDHLHGIVQQQAGALRRGRKRGGAVRAGRSARSPHQGIQFAVAGSHDPRRPGHRVRRHRRRHAARAPQRRAQEEIPHGVRQRHSDRLPGCRAQHQLSRSTARIRGASPRNGSTRVSNKLRVFHSENLWFDPTRFATAKTVTVLLDPKDPKRYHMDVSFLPELDESQ